MLWSENTEANARVSLRQELTHLKKSTQVDGNHLIGADKFTIWLNEKNICTSSDEFVAQLKSGIVPDEFVSQKFPQEHFLNHLEGIDEELNAWIRVKRATFERSSTEALNNLINSESDPVVERAVAALLNFDPTDEVAVKTAILLHLKNGRQPKANSIFEEYCSHLKMDHGLEPSQEVINAINNAEPPATELTRVDRTFQVAKRVSRPLILAHPISEGLLSSPVGQHLQALRMTLLGTLTRFRDWSVREYTEQDQGINKSESDTRCFELVFEGMESSDGSILSISLLEKFSRELIWSEMITAKRDDVVHAQYTTIKRLAAALNLQISARRLENTIDRNESELDQYDRWLRAKQFLSTWNAEDEAKAEAILRSLLAKWPSYAPALSGLVEVLNTRHHIFPGVLPDKKRSEEALVLAKKATKISPQDNRTHLALGWCHLMSGNPQQAIYSFDLALQINEYDPLTVISSAMGYCFAGAKVQAYEAADQALMISAGGEPIHWAYHVCIRYFAEDWEGAWSAVKYAEESAFFLDGVKIAIAGQLGQPELIEEAVSSFRQKISKNWFSSKTPSNENIRHWLISSFPISEEADREKLNLGFDAANFC